MPPSAGSMRTTERSARSEPSADHATSRMTVSLEKPVLTGTSMSLTASPTRSGNVLAIHAWSAPA